MTNQIPYTWLGADGKAVTGMRVSFKTGKGVIADINVPWPDYHPDKVRELIAARVSLLDGVHNLKG